MRKNKDIERYKTASGQVRYKFKIYVGKDEETGNSIQARKQGFKSYEDALKSYFEIQDKIKKGILTKTRNINLMKFINCGLLIMNLQLNQVRFIIQKCFLRTILSLN